MKMKMTVNDVLGVSRAIGELARTDLPPTAAFRLAKIAETIRTDVEAFDKARQSLIEQYMEEDDEGKKKLTEDKGRVSELEGKLGELMDEEVSYDPDIKKITQSCLGDTKVSAATVIGLGKFAEL